MKLAFTIIPLLTEILSSLFHKIQRVLHNVKEKPASVLVGVLLLRRKSALADARILTNLQMYNVSRK